MILCIDVGNSNIFCGVYDADKIKFRFRYNTKDTGSSDQIGVFLRAVLRENEISPDMIKQIAVCSVVPNIDYSLRAACIKYFGMEPFILKAGVKIKLKINYRNPLEVGADLIANAIGAIHMFPNQNIIVADFGTASTLTAISNQQEYLGTVIMPGMQTAMHALHLNTAKLMPVAIVAPDRVIGRSTAEAIQSGLFYGQLAALKEISARIQHEQFSGEEAIIVGTGGFSHLFENEDVFEKILPDLVLDGLRIALSYNT